MPYETKFLTYMARGQQAGGKFTDTQALGRPETRKWRRMLCGVPLFATLLLADHGRALAQAQGLIPDSFRVVTDGADDAPSIQRAITSVCQANSGPTDLQFLSRHYAINSPIVQPCLVNWHGRGWQEEPATPPAPQPPLSTAIGTWFDVGTPFISSAVPVTITGALAAGSVIENIAVDEPGMLAAPSPIVTEGHVTGWSPSSWSPTAYNYIFYIHNAPGVLFKHIMLDGINAGIVSSGSGRTNFYDIRGQAFSYLLNIQDSEDVSRIVDVHHWPYWSSADPVVQYEQANTIGILSLHNDTPFWDRIFMFAVQAGIALSHEPDDTTTTGLAAGTISCDFVKYCIWVEMDSTCAPPPAPSSPCRQTTAQIGNVRSYSQAWNTIFGAAVSLIPGSAALQYDGGSVMQIGTVENFGSANATFAFTNGYSPANINVGSIFVHRENIPPLSPTSYIAEFPTSGVTNVSLLTTSTPPIVSGSGATLLSTNPPPHGSGSGIMQYNTPTVVH